MINISLFADQETKLNKCGDALQLMEAHVNFAVLGVTVDLAAPRPSASAAAIRLPHRTDGACAVDPSAIQLR